MFFQRKEWDDMRAGTLYTAVVKNRHENNRLEQI